MNFVLMKHVFLFLFLAFAAGVSAQNDGWEYPFPYNPDGNADGYISLSDLLDLLVVYGQEFPQGLYSNTEGALLDLGEMDVFSCHLEVSLLEGNWTLPTSEDALNWLPSIGAVASTWFQEGGYTSAGWEYLCVDELGELKNAELNFYNASSNQEFGIPFCTSGKLPTVAGPVPELQTNTHCFAVTRVLPTFEYSNCFASVYGPDEFAQCVTDKLNDGWIPLPGNVYQASGYFQGFARIVP